MGFRRTSIFLKHFTHAALTLRNGIGPIVSGKLKTVSAMGFYAPPTTELNVRLKFGEFYVGLSCRQPPLMSITHININLDVDVSRAGHGGAPWIYCFIVRNHKCFA